MTSREFIESLHAPGPSAGIAPELVALWWDAKGDWARAHAEVDELETPHAMAVHAYLHRKEGVEWNADYWYRRAGKTYRRPTLEEEWRALVEAFAAS
jgi:hypothetical protein